MPPQFYNFSVIIPVYNKWDLTAQCLKSLKEKTTEYNYEVIVVDNGSHDATRANLETLGKDLFSDQFKAIFLETNHNFGPACNLGAQKAHAPLIFFLNNDTLLTSGWAPPLVEALKKEPKLGAVGPLLLYPQKTVQHLGIAFVLNKPIHLYRYFPADHAVVLKERYVQALTAAALMVKREDFLACGGFYEEYKNGFEDVDFCLTLRERGQTLKYIPTSVIYHLESQSPGRQNATDLNSQILKRRFANKYQVDLHIHGLKDGFIPTVADNLDLTLTLSEKTQNDLKAQAEGQNLLFLEELVRQNPLWFRGKKNLASLAEKQGDYNSAAILYYEIATLSKSQADYQKILSLKPYFKIKETSLFTETAKILAEMHAKTHDLTFIKNQIRTIKNMRDKFLYQLYMDKLKKLSLNL